MPLLEPDDPPVLPVQDLLRLLAEADPAAVERIDQELHRLARIAHQEVAREVDPLHRQLQPPSHLQQHHCQGEGNAQPTVQHIVQKRVARIVIVVAVAAQLPDHEEVPDHLGEHHGRRALRAEPVPRLLGEHVEAHQVAVDRELGVLLRGNQKRGPREVELLLGTLHLTGEFAARRRGGRAHGKIPTLNCVVSIGTILCPVLRNVNPGTPPALITGSARRGHTRPARQRSPHSVNFLP